MKDKIKSIVGNGLPYGLFFFGLSLLVGYLFRVRLQASLWMAVIIGVSTLLANGLLYNRFSKPLKELENISLDPDPSEKISVEAPANHLIEESLVPGKLFLTNHRLVFKSYAKGEVDSEEYSWDLKQIKPDNFYSSPWNSGGEFLLKTEKGFSIMFEVNNIKIWKDSFRDN